MKMMMKNYITIYYVNYLQVSEMTPVQWVRRIKVSAKANHTKWIWRKLMAIAKTLC